MDGAAANVLSVPRLRLTRHSPPFYAQDITPIAGPSRLSPSALFIPALDHDDEDDTQSTPRIPVAPAAPFTEPLSISPNGDAALRLRALLARVPNQSAAEKPSPPNSPTPVTPSELDSDFDVPDPNSMSVAPSFAQESLKDLFSRALRDSPQKGRRRGNSVGARDAEGGAKPQAALPSRVHDSAVAHGKRRSLSDDEAEKAKDSRDGPRTFSLRASTYESLRDRLEQSTGSHASSPPMEASELDFAASDASADTATLLRDLASSNALPPAATSTPNRTQASMQMPSHLQMHSNLMDQDSDMQNLMGGLDSLDGDGDVSQISFPASSPPPTMHRAPPTPSRLPRLSQSQAPGHSLDKTAGRHSALGRHTSFDSTSSFSSHGSTPEKDRERERERQWNRPTPATHSRAGTPDLGHSHRHATPSRTGTPDAGAVHAPSHRLTLASVARHNSSPAGRARSGSVASEASASASVRSRTTSVASVEHERERGWNQPNPRLRRTSSNALLSPAAAAAVERVRTLSTPTTPGSAHAHAHARPVSPWSGSTSAAHAPASPHRALHRQASSLSISSVSSASAGAGGSRSGSRASMREDAQGSGEVKLRERNWNAPQPKLAHSSGPRAGAASPLPSPHGHTHALSRTLSLVASPASRPRIGTRARTESLTPSGSGSRVEDSSSSSARKPAPLRQAASVPLLGTSPGEKSTAIAFPRASSPLPPLVAPAPAPEPESDAEGEAELQSGSELEPERELGDTGGDAADEVGDSPGPAYGAPFGGWQFPKAKAALPPLELDSSPEKPTRRARTPGSGERSPSPTTPMEGGARRRSDSRSPSRHRRATAEFSAAVGALPPKIDDPYGVFGEGWKAGPGGFLGGPELSSSPIDGHDTPTMRSVLVVDAERAPSPTTPPLPPMPSFRNDEARLMKALASPQGPAPAEPPRTPAEPDLPAAAAAASPSSLVLSTPPRRSPSSSLRLEFTTPSPPRDLPELPGPPSEEEDDTAEYAFRTPMRPFETQGRADLSSMKTPRPPGAWAATPAPAPAPAARFAPDTPGSRFSSDTSASTMRASFDTPGSRFSSDESTPPSFRAQALPDDSAELPAHGLATPAASFSRASGMPPQTPAPPGAWFATPSFGSERRRSVQKVRFDLEPTESEAEAEAAAARLDDVPEIPSESEPSPVRALGNGLPAIPAPFWPQTQTQSQSHAGRGEVTHFELRNVAGTMIGAAPVRVTVQVQDAAPPVPATPASARPKARRSPTVRMVDAFGRETQAGDDNVPPDEEEDTDTDTDTVAQETPRNRSAVRMVDALGNEIVDSEPAHVSPESPSPSERSDAERPLSHNEALARVRASIADLASGLSDVERSCDPGMEVDVRQLRELEEISRATRHTRDELARRLQQADVRASHSQNGAVRAAALQGGKERSLLGVRSRRVSWGLVSPRVIGCAVVAQILLIIFFYRLSNQRARNLFLTTYYDPFYPELHLHIAKPDLLRRSMSTASLAPSWSLSGLAECARREGWRAALAESAGNASAVVADWQRAAWNAWGSTSAQVWPPT